MIQNQFLLSESGETKIFALTKSAGASKCENIPLEIEICKIDNEKKVVIARGYYILSESELFIYESKRDKKTKYPDSGICTGQNSGKSGKKSR